MPPLAPTTKRKRATAVTVTPTHFFNLLPHKVMVQTTSKHVQLAAALNQPPTRPARRTCPRWTEEHIDVMRQRYQLDGPIVLAERIGHSVGSIRTKASNMGLGRRGKYRPAALVAAPKLVVVQPVATPVLHANAKAKAKKDAQPSAISKMMEQMRALPAAHPRRLAYMLAARTGTGQDAYQAWLNWKPQPQVA